MNRFWFLYGVTLFLSSVLVSLVLWLLFPYLVYKPLAFFSPIPDFLTLSVNNQVSSLNLFIPKTDAVLADNIEPPQIMAKSALVYDLSTNKVIYAKNPTFKLPMASLTKIMTAIIALENKKQDDKYYVFSNHLVGEDSMGLSSGEVLTLQDLLYGLMLPSGNDAAEVIASHFPNGREEFVAAMNNKAKALGLQNTNFTNPSGLEGDGSQYTTTFDLLVITRHAIERFPTFRKVVSTPYYEIPYSENHKVFYLENSTNLLTSYPGVKGVKTGYTPEAGLSLVTYLEYEGQKIIGVLLNSENRRQEMKDLLDYSLKTLGITPPPHS